MDKKMQAMAELTRERLKELLHYEPSNGIFTWQVDRGKARAGGAAGSKGSSGYLEIVVNYKRHLAHRLAFFYMNGAWPAAQIDHIDGNRINNAWSNLREATHKQNHENRGLNKNNKSNHRGVCWNKRYQKWQAQVRHCGRLIYIGCYLTIEEAAAAAEAKRKELFTHDAGRDKVAA